jgi:hypothetical protein
MSKTRLTAVILAVATFLGGPAAVAAASPAVTASTGTSHHAVVADTWTRHSIARDTWT